MMDFIIKWGTRLLWVIFAVLVLWSIVEVFD